MNKLLGSSPKTTLAGVFAFVSTLALALSYQYDTDPNTIPNWESVFAGFGVMFVGLAARDNNVSSEKAGAK